MRRIIATALVLALTAISCGAPSADVSSIPDLPPITPTGLEELLDRTDRPAVVNIWASWCIPCRSEAPLLEAAFAEYGDAITFIGVDVQDNQQDAKEFIAEFDLRFPSFFDPGRDIPNTLGGVGTPVTFFFTADGALLNVHNGVIDDRALALNIDELLKHRG